jgi:hypothetical protein
MTSPTSVFESIVVSLRKVSDYNRDDVVPPAAILWPDEKRRGKNRDVAVKRTGSSSPPVEWNLALSRLRLCIDPASFSVNDVNPLPVNANGVDLDATQTIE